MSSSKRDEHIRLFDATARALGTAVGEAFQRRAAEVFDFDTRLIASQQAEIAKLRQEKRALEDTLRRDRGDHSEAARQLADARRMTSTYIDAALEALIDGELRQARRKLLAIKTGFCKEGNEEDE